MKWESTVVLNLFEASTFLSCIGADMPCRGSTVRGCKPSLGAKRLSPKQRVSTRRVAPDTQVKCRSYMRVPGAKKSHWKLSLLSRWEGIGLLQGWPHLLPVLMVPIVGPFRISGFKVEFCLYGEPGHGGGSEHLHLILTWSQIPFHTATLPFLAWGLPWKSIHDC